jgi:phage shock protein PspC (stress-responsive transcriptional regulator)
MIAGVAAGLAEYFDVDPTLVRLVFVITALLHGIGLLLYIALCIIVPAEDARTEPTAPSPPASPPEGGETPMSEPVIIDQNPEPRRPSREQRHAWAGIILILLGLVFLAQNVGLLWWWQWRLVWPVVLIALGGWLLLRRFRA